MLYLNHDVPPPPHTHSPFQPPQQPMQVPGMDPFQHNAPPMIGGDFDIRSRGGGSSTEVPSPAMIGMAGVKIEPEDPVESEWPVLYCTIKEWIYFTTYWHNFNI